MEYCKCLTCSMADLEKLLFSELVHVCPSTYAVYRHSLLYVRHKCDVILPPDSKTIHYSCSGSQVYFVFVPATQIADLPNCQARAHHFHGRERTGVGQVLYQALVITEDKRILLFGREEREGLLPKKRERERE